MCEEIGSDQAQIERDDNDCEDVYDESKDNQLFDIDNYKDYDKAISDGEDEAPTKN